MSKLWGGRFSKETLKEVETFTSSLNIDQRLWSVDITASVAHANMLGAQNIISAEEAKQITRLIFGCYKGIKKNFKIL